MPTGRVRDVVDVVATKASARSSRTVRQLGGWVKERGWVRAAARRRIEATQWGLPCSSEAESLGKLLIDDNAADVRAQPRDAAPLLPVGLRRIRRESAIWGEFE